VSSARPLEAPLRDEESLRDGLHLRLVPDTLETLLTRVVADLRSSLSDTADSRFGLACRRDAIAVIEAGHAAGLLQARRRSSVRFTA
jgi:hypothetical protein